MVSHCHCGWELPTNIAPFPFQDNACVDDYVEEGVIRKAIVVLDCPQCGCRHRFLNQWSTETLAQNYLQKTKN